MRFRVAHKAASFLMVGSALCSLGLVGGLSWWMLPLAALVGVLSWRAGPETRLGQRLEGADPVLRAGALGVLLLAAHRVYRSFPEPDLTPMLDFVLYLTGYRLLLRRTGRDHLQLYVLSFLIMLAATWLANTAVYALGFAAYVIASTWALILFHLRREIEENYLVKHHAAERTQRVTIARVLDSRRVVGGAFFAATGLAALGVLLGAALVFAIAPRIGIGFLTGGVRRQTSVVGFSDEVRLGRHGVIGDDNQTVILRVKLPRLALMPDDEAREAVIAELYFRGTVYDRYAAGQWLRSQREALRTVHLRRPAPSGGFLAFVEGPEHQHTRAPRYQDLAGSERQEIQIVGLRQPVAFALDRPLAYEIEPPSIGAFIAVDLEPRWSGESALRIRRLLRTGQLSPVQDFAGASYVAYSRDAGQPPPEPLAALEDLDETWRDAHLEVPASLTPRVRELATRITRDGQSAEQKVEAVVRWLRSNKRYTVDLRRDPDVADPLEDFLFVQDAGHCEYFASATAILLRLAGVPTRYVNGFLGGEWNPLTGTIAVRDNRAHSWVEYYRAGLGWTRAEATPSAARPARMGRLRQVIDSIELWWGTWVLEYDAARQVQLVRSLGSSLRKGGGRTFSWPRIDGKRVFAGLVLLALALALWRWWRWWRRRRPAAAQAALPPRSHLPVQRLYRRALDALTRLGITREPAQTPREVLAAACAVLPELRAPLGQITARYERVRYGGQAPDPALVSDLHALVRQVERTVAEHARRPERPARAA